MASKQDKVRQGSGDHPAVEGGCPVPTYVALLRSINVGKHNRIKMVDFRTALGSLGLANVRTYIQSGNAIFESSESAQTICMKIENELLEEYGIETTVVLRNAAEFRKVADACPYRDIPLNPIDSVHVALLHQDTDQQTLQTMENELSLVAQKDTSNDEFRIIDRDVYFLFRQSILESKIGKSLQKLSDKMTMRNFTTITKMIEMMDNQK